MRNISASFIYTGKENFLRNGILVLDNNNVIIDIIDTAGKLKELPFLEYYNGIIVPGFVNAHCHLELSYLRGMLQKPENLVGFVSQIMQKKNNHNKNIEEEITCGDREMQLNGIVGCGDISNTSDSFKIKAKSKLQYHTFIEVLGLNESKTTDIINDYQKLLNTAKKNHLGNVSIVPHAAYSVVPDLMKIISQIADESNSIISIHNQESEEENNIFTNEPGKLAGTLKKAGWKKESFPNTNSSSFTSIAHLLPKESPILFVHNVFTKTEDIQFAQKLFKKRYWVFCPKSNLYISNRLPNLSLFENEYDRICLGTDSLASNDTLSILEEMKILQLKYPYLHISRLLQWATINGAKALSMDDTLGSFEKGKNPGVNLIYNLDLHQFRLTEKSQVKVLA